MRASFIRARSLFPYIALSLALLASPAFPLVRANPAPVLQETFESQLHTLPPIVQAHYATRLYRITGEDKYVFSCLYGAHVQASGLEESVELVKDPAHIQAYIKERIQEQPKTWKGELRRKALQKDGRFLFFAEKIIWPMVVLQQLGLRSEHHEELIAELKKENLRQLFLRPDIVEAWAAQTPNRVVWLHQLGITDLRLEAVQAFAQQFPDPDKLKGEPYANYIYGLTHFIIAESEYFQNFIPRSHYEWIFAHFEQNIDKIIRETKPDVVAEVGLSFLLAGMPTHPAVKKCRKAIYAEIDPVYGMIPSTEGEWDLASGEHRNVLAVLLFRLGSKLHEGPVLGNFSSVVEYLPESVTTK